MWPLCGLLFWLNALLLERCWYVLCVWPARQQAYLKLAPRQGDSLSWVRRQRAVCLGGATHELQQGLRLVRNLIKLCPMLGLLGTVCGMLQVFDALALGVPPSDPGVGNAIASACLTTLMGMGSALLGWVLHGRLQRRITHHLQQLQDGLACEVTDAN
ncbi:MotA/TolQ/ExbB proton channel family protein [Pseudaeromonas paramecii]|uniref:MotA/TolQ/ExbB proton channel family protein n=2 Tax=Pseudaeromonas paramecii TaxID=2138166 RepID=A0ABP8QJ19_9GAMM